MVSLRQLFPRVAVKRLTAVDLPSRGSNQHELNGVSSLKEFFSTDQRLHERIAFHFYRDGVESEHEISEVTFYDARENHPTRTEWRLYYKGEFLARALPDDVLILARSVDGELHGFIFEQASGWLSAAETLFGVSAQPSFVVVSERELSESRIELAQRRILDELGLNVAVPPAVDYVQFARSLLQESKNLFPTTLEMAAAVRRVVRVDPSDPDRTLCYWLDAEEQLFYAMEAELLAVRLERRFESVDEFISLAQSTLQRRKSRMGYSLQNHVTEIFRLQGVKFSAQARTERKNQPDFLFPGEAMYRDPAWPAERLTMLALKSTCKDRWRQILTEADRIPAKHLLTLDQALSVDQLAEMAQSRVQVIVPSPLQNGYAEGTRRSFVGVADFIELVRARQ